MEALRQDLGDYLQWDLEALVPRGLAHLGWYLRRVKVLWDQQLGGTSWGRRACAHI